VKELLKLVNICQSYHKNKRVLFFYGTQCSHWLEVNKYCETEVELASCRLRGLSDLLCVCSDSTTRAELRKLPVIPTSTLKEYLSITYWCVRYSVICYKKAQLTPRLAHDSAATWRIRLK